MSSRNEHRDTFIGVVLLLVPVSWFVSLALTGSAYGDASFAVGSAALGFSTLRWGARGFVGAASLCSLAYAALIVFSGVSDGVAIIEPIFFAGCGLVFAYLWRSSSESDIENEPQV